MEFSTTDLIEYAIEDVFHTHRDHLAELAEYLPNIDSIVVESREEEGDEVRLVNLWTAARTEVPTLIRPFIKPTMLKWTDYATWFESEHVCRWRIELNFLKEAINCSGVNRMSATDEGHTAVEIAGTIEVGGRKIPGVPRLMANKVGRAVEGFIVKTITPNLKKTNDGVRQYLDQRTSSD